MSRASAARTPVEWTVRRQAAAARVVAPAPAILGDLQIAYSSNEDASSPAVEDGARDARGARWRDRRMADERTAMVAQVC